MAHLSGRIDLLDTHTERIVPVLPRLARPIDLFEAIIGVVGVLGGQAALGLSDCVPVEVVAIGRPI
ncbi:hypothetical protein D3C87_2142070 [compost metagenome]